VLGGVFTESLDFADDALLGVIVVSVALPPPTNAREALATHYNSHNTHDAGDELLTTEKSDVAVNPELSRELGQTVAYRLPAMVRVVQAAGRVVRNETDRGIVCLVDSRFQQAEFAALQPPHWHPVKVRSAQLSEALRAFWKTTT